MFAGAPPAGGNTVGSNAAVGEGAMQGEQRGAGLRDIDWSVVTSGLDFLESAVEHLAEGSRRDLCYAALHLSTAIETLLKAQLARHDYKFVFVNISKADRRKYESGDFKSVGIRDAVCRLREGSPRRSPTTKGGASTRWRISGIASPTLPCMARRLTAPRRRSRTDWDALLQLIDREFLPAASDAERERIEADARPGR